MDKFMLAENPMAKTPREAIIHLIDPISIILVHIGHTTTKYPHNHYTYTNADGDTEYYTLSLYHCFATSFDAEVNSPKVMGLFKDAWHWYVAYMQWQDEQLINDDEEN